MVIEKKSGIQVGKWERDEIVARRFCLIGFSPLPYFVASG
jgi:hypothetical protein